jgi:GAF domain-containing protein
VDIRGADFFAELGRMLDSGPASGSALEHVVASAASSLGFDMGGVCLVSSPDRLETVALTHETVEKVDALQSEYGEGPAAAVSIDLECLAVGNLSLESRWPSWTPAVVALGIRSLLAVRLHPPSPARGCLALYATRPRTADRDDVAVAHIFASHASLAFASDRREAELWRAIDARHLIGQAQGILMERFDIDATQAFGVLRRYSNDRNVKLRVIAEWIIEGRALP